MPQFLRDFRIFLFFYAFKYFYVTSPIKFWQIMYISFDFNKSFLLTFVAICYENQRVYYYPLNNITVFLCCILWNSSLDLTHCTFLLFLWIIDGWRYDSIVGFLVGYLVEEILLVKHCRITLRVRFMWYEIRRRKLERNY